MKPAEGEQRNISIGHQREKNLSKMGIWSMKAILLKLSKLNILQMHFLQVRFIGLLQCVAVATSVRNHSFSGKFEPNHIALVNTQKLEL